MLQKIWLSVRSILMTIMFPGTVAFYIPYRMLSPINFTNLEWSFSVIGSLVIIFTGLAILLKCIWEFAYTGEGTLAPFNETKKLVVIGLYRYIRNPMYVGVLLLLLGETWFFQSRQILIYTGIFFIIFNLVIIGYEEPRLRFKFGDEYRVYCKNVGRWIPRRPQNSNVVK